jgi:hypothetical protein
MTGGRGVKARMLAYTLRAQSCLSQLLDSLPDLVRSYLGRRPGPKCFAKSRIAFR